MIVEALAAATLAGAERRVARFKQAAGLYLSIPSGAAALDVLDQPGGLVISDLGDQLLRDPEHHGPAKNLRRAVECTEARDEVRTYDDSPVTMVTAPLGA